MSCFTVLHLHHITSHVNSPRGRSQIGWLHTILGSGHERRRDPWWKPVAVHIVNKQSKSPCYWDRLYNVIETAQLSVLLLSWHTCVVPHASLLVHPLSMWWSENPQWPFPGPRQKLQPQNNLLGRSVEHNNMTSKLHV